MKAKAMALVLALCILAGCSAAVKDSSEPSFTVSSIVQSEVQTSSGK